jgi:hypothetical protein
MGYKEKCIPRAAIQRDPRLDPRQSNHFLRYEKRVIACASGRHYQYHDCQGQNRLPSEPLIDA